MDDTELRLYAAEAFRQMDLLHPSIEQVADFAAGQLSGSSREEVETHLAECDPCRRRFDEYRQFVADCELPAGKEPEQDLGDEWEQLRRRIWRHRLVRALPRWGGIAAAVIAVAGLSWFTLGTLSPSPAKLLAKAYHEQRTSEFRLASAEHSEVRRQRGGQSAFRLPPALLKAQAKLAESNQDDPEVLRLKGEAQMMAGDAAEAVQTLEMARDLRAQDAHILADLGTAYAFRGDIEKQYGDYLSAADSLGYAVHLDPRAQEAVFNLALVLEKMMLKDQAIEQWNNYLRLDSTSDWAKEARQHLDALQAELKRRKDALDSVVDDPSRFVAQVAAGYPIDAEAYLRDVVITKWLPKATSDVPAREACTRLGQILKERHGDLWLAECVESLRNAEASGLRDLAAARTGNQRGDDMNGALKSARDAKRTFSGPGTQPENLWARFEEVASLRGLMQYDECLAAAEQVMQDLATHHYAWLTAQLQIQAAVCFMRLGRLADGAAQLRHAIQAGQTARFGDTFLNASNRYLTSVRHIGLPSDIFVSAAESLRVFWSGFYQPNPFYQLVDELRDIAGRTDQKYAAWFLARSAMWAVTTMSDRRVEALESAALAVIAQDIGDEKAARATLDISEQLFAGLPLAYRSEPQISLANAELRRGNVSTALNRLEELRSAIEPPPSVLVGTLYYSVLGEAYRRSGNLVSAMDAFRRSIDLGRKRIASLASETERSGVLETVESSYRGLVAVTVASSMEPAAGLQIWQSFRALDAVGDPGVIRQPSSPVLWFVELPDEFVCWLSCGDQVTLYHINAPKEIVGTVAARFRRACSDQASSAARLQEDGQQLYQWMVGPFASQLSEHPELIFELDGALAGVPVRALISRDGQYLGDQFSVLVSSGNDSRRQDLQGQNPTVLVVANPAITGRSAARFPPLPESREEAEVVREIFPNSTILEGRSATVDALVALLPAADIVHFAGHGYADSENGALIFAPKDPKSLDYELLRSADLRRQDWSRCRLAVLSACAAASGETRGAHNPESLVRALTKAGASRIVASLWNVDSAATEVLMKHFYGSLAGGERPERALQTAQQQLRRRSAEWDHPYYWSGFQLYGMT